MNRMCASNLKQVTFFHGNENVLPFANITLYFFPQIFLAILEKLHSKN